MGDYQGSAQVMMTAQADPATATITRNAYTPYGAKRDYDANNDSTADAQLSLERGWLSQVADEDPTTGGTGLTYLNARYYDPAASRFISPDPLLDVMDPKTLDPYRYADNNPIVFTDATGLAAACSGVSGSAEARCLDAYHRGTNTDVPQTKTRRRSDGSKGSDGRTASDLSYWKMVEWVRSEDGQFVRSAMAVYGPTINDAVVCEVRDGFPYLSGACTMTAIDVVGNAGVPVGVGLDVKNIFLKNFPTDHEWDMKMHLRREMGPTDDGADPDKWFDMGNGFEIYDDVYGNIQGGAMFANWGFSEEAIQEAQLMGGAAGPKNRDDSVAVSLGYEFGKAHPQGLAPFTPDELWEFISDPNTLSRLAAPGTEKVQPVGTAQQNAAG